MNLSDHVINAASAIVAVDFIDHGFEKRFGGSHRRLLFGGACVLYFLTVTGLNMASWFEGALGFFYGAVLVLYGMTALKGKWHEFLIAGAMWVFIAMVSAYMIYGVLGVVSGEKLETILPLTGRKLCFASVAALVVKFSMGRATMAFFRRQSGFHRTDKWIVAVVFVLTTLLTMGLFVMEIGEPEGVEREWIVIGILVCEIFVVVFLVEMYRRLGLQQQKELELQYEVKRMDEQKERMEELYRISREVNHWRHDMLGALGTMYQLQKNGKYTEVTSHLEQWYGNLKNYPELPQSTGNEGLDAALMRMIPRCREENITFGYVILGTVADMEQPDSMTLGRLTDNLFMNALEACRQEGTERMIDFRLRAQENNMEIRLKNGIKESVLGTNPNLHTRKTETDRHGFGMESIWQIVETYHGTYEYWEEDGLFCQRIMLEFTGTVSNLEKI